MTALEATLQGRLEYLVFPNLALDLHKKLDIPMQGIRLYSPDNLTEIKRLKARVYLVKPFGEIAHLRVDDELKEAALFVPSMNLRHKSNDEDYGSSYQEHKLSSEATMNYAILRNLLEEHYKFPLFPVSCYSERRMTHPEFECKNGWVSLDKLIGKEFKGV